MSCLSPRVGFLLSNIISPPFQSSPPHHHLQLFRDFKTIYSGRASFPGLGMGRAFSLTTTGVVMISLNSLPTRASWHLRLILKGCAFTAHFIAFIASILACQSRSKNCLPFAALTAWAPGLAERRIIVSPVTTLLLCLFFIETVAETSTLWPKLSVNSSFVGTISLKYQSSNSRAFSENNPADAFSRLKSYRFHVLFLASDRPPTQVHARDPLNASDESQHSDFLATSTQRTFSAPQR